MENAVNMNVSYFNHVHTKGVVKSLVAVLSSIRDGDFKDTVLRVQDLLNKSLPDEAKKVKSTLPCFVASGVTVGGHGGVNLKQYNNTIILDIDHVAPDGLPSLIQAACNSPYTMVCFRSPSYLGCKILVKTDNNPEYHIQAFIELKAYFENLLNVKIDPTGKNITRLCFMSYDPDLFFNPDSQIFKTKTTMIHSDIENIVAQIEQNHIDITSGYENWLKTGFALASEMGEGGRDFFHRISRFNNQYNSQDCDKQYSNCLNSRNSGVTIKTLFYFAKQAGIDISQIRSFSAAEIKAAKPKADTKTPGKPSGKASAFVAAQKFLCDNYQWRFNVVTCRPEVKSSDGTSFEPIDDYVENTIYCKLHENGISITIPNFKAIINSEFCSKYDPFVEYFESLPAWDGQTDYISQLAETVHTDFPDLWQTCFKKWIVAVVASLLVPEVVNQTAIIFLGAQGIGKTTWMIRLCPPELKKYLFTGTVNTENKDTLIHLSECMFINLDELENLSRPSSNTLKEIITKPSVLVRRPFMRNADSYIRRASFMGSVNTAQFLNDSSGSRRFLCFETIKINLNHEVDIRLVYAQALALFRSGFAYFFNLDEINIINENNEKYQNRTIEEEYLLLCFEPAGVNDALFFYSASQVLSFIAPFAHINPNNNMAIVMGKSLKKYGFTRVKKNGNYVYAMNKTQFGLNGPNNYLNSNNDSF